MDVRRRVVSAALRRRASAIVGAAASLFVSGAARADAPPPPGPDAIRIAFFNVNQARNAPGVVIDDLRAGPDGENWPRIDAVIEIIQRARPDILAINELDWDPAGEALELFALELARGRPGAAGADFPYLFAAPVNSGEPSGFDLDRNGGVGDPGDAFGWGLFPGQFGMAVLSRFPLQAEAARTFQLLRWSDALWAQPPLRPDGAPYYLADVWATLRLSSKSHWDLPVALPDGRRLHVLLSHPTPPVFDGPEDRNGLRNAAEIRFWRDYIGVSGASADWILDDQDRQGGLASGASFVILGDLNADPADGDGRRDEIAALLGAPSVQDPRPASAGAVAAAEAQGGENDAHAGDPALDTSDWRDRGGDAPGNLRVDYVLPSADLTVAAAGVFWPAPDDPLARLVAFEPDGRRPLGSDHRLVWVDITLEN